MVMRKPLCVYVLLGAAMLVLVNGVRHGGEEGAAQQVLDADVPLTAYKRFYRWEDSKRAVEDEESMRAKRKQFYAWAGKRAAPLTTSDSEETQQQMQKRKQFYAWAGK